MFLLLCFAAGAVLTVQALINSSLSAQLSSPFMATMVSLMGSLVLVGALMPMMQRTETVQWQQLANVPWYLLLGGMGGAIFLLATIIATPRIGAVAVFCLIVAGQLSSALVLEVWRVGVLQALSWEKLTGIALERVDLCCIVLQQFVCILDKAEAVKFSHLNEQTLTQYKIQTNAVLTDSS